MSLHLRGNHQFRRNTVDIWTQEPNNHTPPFSAPFNSSAPFTLLMVYTNNQNFCNSVLYYIQPFGALSYCGFYSILELFFFFTYYFPMSTPALWCSHKRLANINMKEEWMLLSADRYRYIVHNMCEGDALLFGLKEYYLNILVLNIFDTAET